MTSSSMAGRAVLRWRGVALCALTVFCTAAGDLRAQTRADSAAVLLGAAEQLRMQGDAAAARSLLDLIARQYAGTPAAQEVERMLALLRRMPEAERPGRTELLLFGAGYGAWLGVAVPLALDADEPAAYGIGLLLGAPAGFLAARQYASARQPTYGQTRALTFGGMWGTANGMALAEILDLGTQTETFCDLGACYEYETGDDGQALVAAGIAGGLVGIGAGAYLARKPIPAGVAATVTLGSMWGGWFGFAGTFIAGERDDALLTGTMIGGNAALLATALLAPRWQLSESRARLISVGGIIGGLAGAGLLLIIEPDDDEMAMAVPLATSALGLGLGAWWTRHRDLPDEEGGRGALINHDRGRWALDVPHAAPTMRRDGRALRAGAHIPLVRARF